MKLILMLLSLTAGAWAVIQTVDLMNDAAAVMQNAAELGRHH